MKDSAYLSSRQISISMPHGVKMVLVDVHLQVERHDPNMAASNYKSFFQPYGINIATLNSFNFNS